MRHGPCGAELPAEVGAYVTHVAECPQSGSELGAWCRAIVGHVTAEALAEADETPSETPTVSPETSGETRETTTETPRDITPMSVSRMAELRDSGLSLRVIGRRAGIAPETVRRRLARHHETRGETP